MSKITSIATGVPAYKYLQTSLSQFAEESFAGDPGEARKLRFLYNHSGIRARHSVLPDFDRPAAERDFFKGKGETAPGISARMALYDRHALPLSADTIEKCISGRIEKSAITHLITVSCTGMSAPGLDLQLLEYMGLPETLNRTSVNFMGCYAAVHAMKIADAFCNSTPDANVIIVCTELCSLHFQQDHSVDNMTASLIFADGCAAVLMQSAPIEKGIRINNFFSSVLLNGKKDMAWQLSPTGFVMTLSSYIPELIRADFKGMVSKALEKTGRSKEDVTHWCIHPGGKKILEAIGETMDISTERLQYSYDILNDYGNMSSPTILFVLKKILDELEQSPDKKPVIFGAAFGPGLTMETFTATYD